MSNDTVYVLLDVTVKNRDKFIEYVEGHRSSFHQYGGKLLFRSNDMEAVKGDWSPKLLVVHEWPSEQAFRHWDASAEYAPWKMLRKDAMDMVLARTMKGSLDP